jgi:2-polyprenyl-3-methyl-5-hydroxy-6-metoxy-1,4-benzoquinol methylase
VSVEKSAAGDTPSTRPILEMATAFQRSRVLLTAYELGLFTVINDEWKTSADVATALESDPRATDRLMNALTALGLLEKRDGRFTNSPAAARFLVKGRPEYMAGLAHTAHLWQTWSGLTDAVRQGTGTAGDDVNQRGDEWLRAFIGAMHWRAQQMADGVVRLLDLSGVSRVLDVGGGSGAFSMAFVRAGRGVHAVVFDLPNVVPITKGYVESAGYGGQVSAVVGDYRRDELPAGFDLVFLSAIVHANDVEENRRLIRKCAAATAPGGQVVVLDQIMNEDRTAPAPAAMFALNMLVGTGGGDTYTESEVRAWMEEAGLRNLARIDTPFNNTAILGVRS